MKVIEKANIGDLDSDIRRPLKDITDSCKVCQLTRDKPRLFFFSVKDGITGEFNPTLQMNVVHIPDENVLHIVCQGTGFQQGIFLNKMSAEAAWRALKMY